MVGHIEETMPNDPLKFKNLYYEVLQLDISNFKSTGRLIEEKDKTCLTWQCHVGQLALKMDLQTIG